ncbi:hypothetical protein [Microlunatus sp. GCM10028923]|uniref:hypothetical protein n=1 Tax=Microlunatus sp. GCM10028923 TaxID=3273400 RepID=UPI003617ADDF
MALNDIGPLLTAIGRSAIADPPAGWESITVTMTGLGPMTSVSGAATVGGVPRYLSIDGDAVDSAENLRTMMYAEHTGTWYRATLTITPDGQINSDFDYDGKPYDPEDEGTEPIIDLLMRDQKRYPRDPEHLPDWHPAKQA